MPIGVAYHFHSEQARKDSLSFFEGWGEDDDVWGGGQGKRFLPPP